MRSKLIDGYTHYSVFEDGTIFSSKSGKNIKPLNTSRNKQGKLRKYHRVCLCEGGVKRYYAIHRLVARAFIPNPENKPHVNHKDANRFNNSVDNLEWVTVQENIEHSVANRLNPVGERCGQSVVTEEQVREIRKLRETGMSYPEISKLTGVKLSTCGAIGRRQNWFHI